ncbi:MAG: hypothetical protein ACPG61_18180 [Paracoccaceae bacterium]
MADFDRKLTVADQTLAFGLTWMVSHRRYDASNVKMWAAVLRDVIPFASDDHSIVKPMIEAATYLIANINGDGEPGVDHAWAQLRASTAVEGFAQWRAARSYEVFKQMRGDDR